MISICVPFYPWYREYDRTEEIFDVLIASMNRCKRKGELELSIVDGGTEDIWGRQRRHISSVFLGNLFKSWDGKLKYSYDKEVIYRRSGNRRSFWVSKAVDKSVKQSSYDMVLTVGIDIEIPVDFVDIYESWVSPGNVFVFRCWHIRRDMPREQMPNLGGWRSARGIIGAMKSDYFQVGGQDLPGFVKDKADTDLYLRLKKAFNLKEIYPKGMFHVDHPGCNERTSEFKGNW